MPRKPNISEFDDSGALTVTVISVPNVVADVTVGEIVIVALLAPKAVSTAFARVVLNDTATPEIYTTLEASYAAEVSAFCKYTAFDVSTTPKTMAINSGKQSANSTAAVPDRSCWPRRVDTFRPRNLVAVMTRTYLANA